MVLEEQFSQALSIGILSAQPSKTSFPMRNMKNFPFTLLNGCTTDLVE